MRRGLLALNSPTTYGINMNNGYKKRWTWPCYGSDIWNVYFVELLPSDWS